MWEVLRFDFKNKQNPTNLLSLLDLSTDESVLDDPKFILARFIENRRTFTSNEVLKVLNWIKNREIFLQIYNIYLVLKSKINK